MGKARRDLLKARPLRDIGRIFGLIGAGQMADQQPWLDPVEQRGIGQQPLEFIGGRPMRDMPVST
jgi:hypothetical protein